MLNNGAHISIAGIPLMLARDPSDQRLLYEETFESLFAPATAIAGEIAKEQVRPEKLLWPITDWAGGEGALIYYPQDPTTYDVGSLINPTTRGKVTTRPRRYRSSVARAGTNADTSARPVGVSTYRHAFVFWEDNIIDSLRATSWVATQDTTPAMTRASYADAISDGTNVAALPAVGGAASSIPVVQADSNTTTWADMETGVTITPPIVGAVLDGVPYTFSSTGTALVLKKKAAVMDSAADWGATTIYTTGITPSGTWGEDYWTDCEAAENSLFFSYSSQNQCFIWECRADIGRPFWTGPPGFAGKKLVYTNGILFILGNQATSGGKMFAGIWAIPLATRSPVFIAAPRKHHNAELTDFSIGCAGPGATVFAADASAGKVFIYDIERDAIHLFDDLANGGTGDGTSFTPYLNLLDPQTSSIEVALTSSGLGSALLTNGWWAETNCGVSRSLVAGGKHGSAALRLSSTAGGNMAAITDIGLAGVPVSPSTAYAVSMWFQSAVSVRACNAIIRWYDSSGTIISSTTGADTNDAVGSWTEVTATATSPANAAFAAIAAQVKATGGAAELHYVDAVNFQQGSSVGTDRMGFLALHGTRLYTATYRPLDSTGTSLQVISWDDLQPESRDASQAISATFESAEWDFGIPMEMKALVGFYVTYEITDAATTSGLVANSRITVSYAKDGGAYTNLTTITSATTPSGGKGRVFIQVSDATTTQKFTLLKVKATLDNNSTTVAPPVLRGITAEAQLLAYARTWDVVVQVEDEENNERPASRQNSGYSIHTALTALATNKNIVPFLDGAWSANPGVYDTHTVMVEDPRSLLGDRLGNGLMRLRLRSVLT